MVLDKQYIMMRFSPLILFLFASCSTLMTAGAAAGGAALGSLAGPGGAAIGGAAGVVAVDLIEDEAPVEVIGDGPAATVHHVDNLVNTVGWWYLAIFVLIPLLTKRGRGWITNFTKLHNNASKKDVSEQADRLNNLEEELTKLSNSRKRK